MSSDGISRRQLGQIDSILAFIRQPLLCIRHMKYVAAFGKGYLISKYQVLLTDSASNPIKMLNIPSVYCIEIYVVSEKLASRLHL
jgi:hypothetical protein